MKKLYARTTFTESPYLTAGKLYPVIEERGPFAFLIKSDNLESDEPCYCLWHGCAHIGGHGNNWERVEVDEPEESK